jgi:hypothetical protein
MPEEGLELPIRGLSLRVARRHTIKTRRGELWVAA